MCPKNNKTNSSSLTTNRTINETPSHDGKCLSDNIRLLLRQISFSYSSFTDLPSKYLIYTSITMIIFLITFKLANILVLLSKFNLNGDIGSGWIDFRNNLILSAMLTPLSPLLWGTLLYAIIAFMGGKGKYRRSIAIYLIAQCPVIIGDIILFIIAFTQPTINIAGSALKEQFMQLSATYFKSHNIATMIIEVITTIYANLVGGIGMSADQKAPELLGIIAGLVIATITIVFGIFIF